VVALGILPELVEQGRIAPTPAIAAAVAADDTITDRVSSTVRIVASPASLC
jgi:hypothetical protein